jgi:hypothetical protein
MCNFRWKCRNSLCIFQVVASLATKACLQTMLKTFCLITFRDKLLSVAAPWQPPKCIKLFLNRDDIQYHWKLLLLIFGSLKESWSTTMQCALLFTFSLTFINCCRHFRGHTKWLPLAYNVTETYSASNYSAIQKLKPWLQSQVVPMKWEVCMFSIS